MIAEVGEYTSVPKWVCLVLLLPSTADSVAAARTTLTKRRRWRVAVAVVGRDLLKIADIADRRDEVHSSTVPVDVVELRNFKADAEQQYAHA